MKTIYSIPCFFITCLALGGMICSCPAWAQDDTTRPQEARPATSGHSSIHESPGNGDIYDVKFPGGTIKEYVDLIREARYLNNEQQLRPVNVIVTDSAKDFMLPEIIVQTNIEGLIGIMEACQTQNAYIVVQPDSSGNAKVISVERQIETVVTVINANQLLADLDRDKLLSAIEIGLEMLGPEEPVTLKLHEETGLIFARGPHSGTQLIHEIVQQLEQGTRGPGGFGDSPTGESSRGNVTPSGTAK